MGLGGGTLLIKGTSCSLTVEELLLLVSLMTMGCPFVEGTQHASYRSYGSNNFKLKKQ